MYLIPQDLGQLVEPAVEQLKVIVVLAREINQHTGALELDQAGQDQLHDAITRKSATHDVQLTRLGQVEYARGGLDLASADDIEVVADRVCRVWKRDNGASKLASVRGSGER
jgi:hypothetical protein